MKQLLSKKNRALVAELVRTDFKLRYQGSVLGYAWSLLRPLLMFVILYIVFVKFLKIGDEVPHFPVYLLLGIVVWNFFTEMTQQSLTSVVARGDLIRKIKIPRWIIVISSSLSAVINMGLTMMVITIFMVVNKVDVSREILAVPLILLQVYIFSLGMSFFLSAAFVKYRDISYIWEVILQAGFYATPILYPISIIQNEMAQKVLFMNPMTQTIQGIRYAMVTQETITIWKVFDGGWYSLIPIILTGVIFVFGVWYFRRESKYFAENI